MTVRIAIVTFHGSPSEIGLIDTDEPTKFYPFTESTVFDAYGFVTWGIAHLDDFSPVEVEGAPITYLSFDENG